MWGEPKPVVMGSSFGCSGSSDYAGITGVDSSIQLRASHCNDDSWTADSSYSCPVDRLDFSLVIVGMGVSLGRGSIAGRRRGAESPYLNACARAHTY